MSNIVTVADFVGEINIPGTNRDEVVKQLQPMIDKYEVAALEELLGAALYASYVIGIATVPVPQRITDLLNGVSYTYNGKTVLWKGLKQKNFIANFVYYYWMKNLYSITTPVGEATPATENSTAANPIRKMVKAWNDMAEPIINLAKYLNANSTIYPEWESRVIRFKRINEFGL